MTRFEEILTSYGDAQPSTSQLAQDIDVPEPSLRLFCAEFLGMTPSQYARLRRLNLVRMATARVFRPWTVCDAVPNGFRRVAVGYFSGATVESPRQNNCRFRIARRVEPDYSFAPLPI